MLHCHRYERDDFTVVIQPAFVNIKPFYSYSKVQRKQVDLYKYQWLHTVLRVSVGCIKVTIAPVMSR